MITTKNIQNSKELKEEIQRLSIVKLELEKKIETRVKDIISTYHPANLTRTVIDTILTDKSVSEQIASRSSKFFTGLVIDHILLRNSSFLVRKAITMAISPLLARLARQDVSVILDKIKSHVDKLFSEKDKGDSEFNEEDIYHA